MSRDEFNTIESPTERRRARREFNRRLYKKPLWLVVCIAVPVGIAAGLACTDFARWLTEVVRSTGVSAGLARPLAMGILGAAIGGLAGGGAPWLFRRQLPRARRQYLRELGYPVCLHCGYNLQGQTEPRCPECGQPSNPTDGT